MLKGLRKRETYDELINELGDDPIKKYPDRRASQIENSNFMSQLASGFREVIEQNERLMKEKTKQLLLQDLSSSSNESHQKLIHSDHGSSLRGSSMYESAPSVQFVDDPNDMFYRDVRASQAADEALRRSLGMPQQSLISSLVDDTYQVERGFLEHTAQIEAEQERERHIQQLRIENMREQTRALVDRANETSILALPPPVMREQASSSSSMPVRLAIQDTTQEPQQPQISDSDEELIPAEPEFRPERLQPREEEVRHLFKPKRERKGKPTAANEKIYHDTFADWNAESLKVLKEQILFRPEIELTKGEFGQLTKTKALILIRNHDKKHPKINT